MLRLLLCTLVCAVCTFLKIFGGIPRTGDCRKIFPRADNDLNKIQASSMIYPHSNFVKSNSYSGYTQYPLAA